MLAGNPGLNRLAWHLAAIFVAHCCLTTHDQTAALHGYHGRREWMPSRLRTTFPANRYGCRLSSLTAAHCIFVPATTRCLRAVRAVSCLACNILPCGGCSRLRPAVQSHVVKLTSSNCAPTEQPPQRPSVRNELCGKQLPDMHSPSSARALQPMRGSLSRGPARLHGAFTMSRVSWPAPPHHARPSLARPS